MNGPKWTHDLYDNQHNAGKRSHGNKNKGEKKNISYGIQQQSQQYDDDNNSSSNYQNSFDEQNQTYSFKSNKSQKHKYNNGSNFNSNQSSSKMQSENRNFKQNQNQNFAIEQDQLSDNVSQSQSNPDTKRNNNKIRHEIYQCPANRQNDNNFNNKNQGFQHYETQKNYKQSNPAFKKAHTQQVHSQVLQYNEKEKTPTATQIQSIKPFNSNNNNNNHNNHNNNHNNHNHNNNNLGVGVQQVHAIKKQSNEYYNSEPALTPLLITPPDEFTPNNFTSITQASVNEQQQLPKNAFPSQISNLNNQKQQMVDPPVFADIQLVSSSQKIYLFQIKTLDDFDSEFAKIQSNVKNDDNSQMYDDYSILLMKTIALYNAINNNTATTSNSKVNPNEAASLKLAQYLQQFRSYNNK